MPNWFDVGVLTIFSTFLVALTLQRLVRLFHPRGSRTVAAWLLLGAVALLAWCAFHEWRHQWTQQRATAVVQAVTGNPDAVARCERFTSELLNLSQNAGSVSWDEPEVANLRRNTCAHLYSWLTSDKRDPDTDQIQAVHVLVHEAVHVAGFRSESETECYALQLDARAAELLGASSEQAQALALAYYTDSYPYLRSEYRSGACRQDGALDLTPEDGVFP